MLLLENLLMKGARGGGEGADACSLTKILEEEPATEGLTQ